MSGVRSNGTVRVRKLAGDGVRVEQFLIGNVWLLSAGKPVKFSDLQTGMQIEMKLKGDKFPIEEIVESVSEDKACLRQA